MATEETKKKAVERTKVGVVVSNRIALALARIHRFAADPSFSERDAPDRPNTARAAPA